MDKKENKLPATKLSAKAVARYIRVSPRKVRLVLDVIRRKNVGEAFATLTSMKKRTARVVEKVLKSALANAKQKQMNGSKLFVRTAFADGGPTMKRYLPRAMGRADTILKRSAHITLVLEEGNVRTGRLFKSAPAKKESMGKRSKQKTDKKEAKAGV